MLDLCMITIAASNYAFVLRNQTMLDCQSFKICLTLCQQYTIIEKKLQLWTSAGFENLERR